METPIKPTRRDVLRAFLAMPASLLLAACAADSAGQTTSAQPTAAPATQPLLPTATALKSTDTPESIIASASTDTIQAVTLQPTPVCGDDDDEPTLAQTEGPYYTPNTPKRTSLLEPGMPGTKLVVTGYVLSTACQPVNRALIDFWHCDDAGVYDNVGYKLRGHQFSDEQGRFYLETIVPGLYPGRTRHIHVKVQAPNQPVLTTQLYFPNEPGNARDRIFNSTLVMDVQDVADGKAANFNFVVEV